MNNCAESQTRICKAYIADCYGHIANAYNQCRSAERILLKRNIFNMLDRIKALLDNATTIQDDEITENEADSIDDSEIPME